MTVFTVGPNSSFETISGAIAVAGANDTVQLEAGYSNETATVTRNGMIVTGQASSTGIVLKLAAGVGTVTLSGEAQIDVYDSHIGNTIAGNDGANLIRVSAGADTVSGGLGDDRLLVDYRLTTGAVTGDSTSNFTEAGGVGRMVTINGGFEHVTIRSGSGADTITTGAGDDVIITGEGAATVTAGGGKNYIVGGSGADTITALNGGNVVDAGNGENTITTGSGIDHIRTGLGADTVIAGTGNDRITIFGGADDVDAGAGTDYLLVNYAAATTDVTGGIASGNGAAGYGGQIADLAGATLDFTGVEKFWITTGSGDDSITTGAGREIIDGGNGNDLLDAGGGTDWVNGGAGDDTLLGRAGADQLFGGDGADRLFGGFGQDMLTGGLGNDQFIFVNDPTTGVDQILDFEASGENDTIMLQNSVFTGLTKGWLDTDQFHVGAAAADAEDRVIFNAATGELFYDGDGIGGLNAVQLAMVTPYSSVAFADILVV